MLGGFFVFVINKAVQARRGRVYTGSEELIGERAVVRTPLDPVGHVFVQGALWRAVAPESESLEVGDQAIVEKVDGLTLTVRKASDTEKQAKESETLPAQADAPNTSGHRI
jgi:membrane-bound ClpP family serine protease